jgi:glycosyltransferase involved in cell wall biosynthesis
MNMEAVLSVIVPCMNEERSLNTLCKQLFEVLSDIEGAHEVIFIDDGSTDGTVAEIKRLSRTYPGIRLIEFARNFGKEAALSAGLDAAKGEAAILMDADLQHPPEFILELYQAWRDGGEIVYGVRTDRSSDGFLRRQLSSAFYKMLRYLGETPIPENAGDYRLIDRKAVDAIKVIRERNRFMKGIYTWVGFRTIALPLNISQRIHGRSTFSFRKLFDFAIDGVTAFSNKPLRVAGYTGALVAILAVVYGLFEATRTLIFGVEVPGFTTIIVAVTLLGGIQMMFLGVIGEYIGRVYTEVKGRPIYIVRNSSGFDE